MGGCYLETSCGSASCLSGQSVYQEVNVANISPRSISYGGKFAIDKYIFPLPTPTPIPVSGSLNLVLSEFDANSNLITSQRSTINLTSVNQSNYYQFEKRELTLNNQTRTVRFAIEPKTPSITFKADEMFIEPMAMAPTPTPTPLIGDIDRDGDVDIYDYNILVSHFGPRMPPGSPADLDHDGDVDIFDYNLLVSNFGRRI